MNAMSKLRVLEELKLSHNPIEVIPDNAFQSFGRYLQTLNLDNMKLKKVSPFSSHLLQTRNTGVDFLLFYKALSLLPSLAEERVGAGLQALPTARHWPADNAPDVAQTRDEREYSTLQLSYFMQNQITWS